MNESLRHCENCVFSHKQQRRDQNGAVQVGQHFFTCHRLPPTPVMVPMQNGSAGVVAQFPPVDKNICCAEHRPAEQNGDDAQLTDGLPKTLLG